MSFGSFGGNGLKNENVSRDREYMSDTSRQSELNISLRFERLVVPVCDAQTHQSSEWFTCSQLMVRAAHKWLKF